MGNKISRTLLPKLRGQGAGVTQSALETAIKVLEKIADCSEGDLARYCAKVDALAVDALVNIECSLPD